MPRRVTPSQLRSMLRRAEQEQRNAINKYNREVRKYNQDVKRSVDNYNREVRAHNSRVRANRRRLQSELNKLAHQPGSTSRVQVTYRRSVRTLHESFVRLESSPSRSHWGPDGEELFDLAEGEAANSVSSLNALLGGAEKTEEPPESLRQSTLNNELLALSQDLDERWRGALFALSPENPDAARHFCASSREILVSVLDIGAPDDLVLGELADCPLTDQGRPTRRAKIQFCVERSSLASPELIDFVDEDMENVATLFGVFNDGTHGHAGKFDLNELSGLKVRVEDAIRFLNRLVH